MFADGVLLAEPDVLIARVKEVKVVQHWSLWKEQADEWTHLIYDLTLSDGEKGRCDADVEEVQY